MANGLSITFGLNETKIFECPNCKQTIDTSAPQCRFCSALIDPEAAQSAASTMARINRACSDASYLKIAAGALPVFIVLIFVPFLTWLGGFGSLFLLYAIPIGAVVWGIRFWSIKTEDPDFRRAKRTVLTVGTAFALLILLNLFR